MNIRQIIEYLKNDSSFMENISLWKTLPPVDGIFKDFPQSINSRLRDIYIEKGIKKLYHHQWESFNSAQKGLDSVVVTPTASGKTLCYNLPVVDHIIKNPESRALYIFPTKALAQDQMHELNRLIDKLDFDIKSYTFDGDTPASARKAIRSAGHIVITNPDMLHSGILPHHTIWIKLFENLKYIVIDEVHSYRGVFGSHLANVIRRLKRICKFYGSNPQFILCSATIANPGSHAESLIEKPVHLIDKNGAPQGEKNYLIYNPPVVNKQLGIRASSIKEASKIGANLIKNKIPTIVFARSRTKTEVISKYLKGRCPGANISAYRGGYLPDERRRIEKKLRNGDITGVVSTNALELGIDIGMLDAVISVGYPGSISSMYQQFGRGGRRGEPSLSIMVASSSPLDQYIAGNPDFIKNSNPEQATINPDNLLILMDHIKCAAFELPFTEDERFTGHLSTTVEMLDYLTEMNILKKNSGKYHWMSQIYPANEISLRTASQENFVIVDKTDKTKVIGEVDYHSAPTLIYDDAIYLHQGKQYYIDKLDWDRRTAFCHEVDSDYYTDAEVKTELQVLEENETKEMTGVKLFKGELNIREKAMMFKKIKFNSHENLGWAKIDLKEMEMHSTAMWIDFEEAFFTAIINDGGDGTESKEAAGSILYALSYILKNISPIYTISDIMDIHTQTQSKSDHSGKPSIYIYDSIPGGCGISERIFDIFPLISEESIKVIMNCHCDGGCPGCIGPVTSDNPKIKDYTIKALERIIYESSGQTKYLH